MLQRRSSYKELKADDVLDQDKASSEVKALNKSIQIDQLRPPFKKAEEPEKPRLHVGRPPSGRVKIQLDPNASDYYNNIKHQKDSRQNVALLS